MTTVTAPLSGRVVPLAEAPDPVFADALVGPGVAIHPAAEGGPAVAPVEGIVVSLHPHAFTVVDASGHGVLTHLGIDTVQLAGEGFEPLVGKGDRVVRGQPLVRWDPEAVARSGRPTLCPVVALEASARQLGELALHQEVRAGDPLFTWT